MAFDFAAKEMEIGVETEKETNELSMTASKRLTSCLMLNSVLSFAISGQLSIGHAW